MYLKSLELQGFKSFPDKTVLNFDRGISAIVGPNGSGKSNISDAIRWVLGEQSSKALRGAKMEDVIFGGTQHRGPVGYAEVSLILDNSDGALPSEDSEVMVTRRYFRSGESEYFLNRASVRLRDIHEMFMDTGLGRDGYSMIGQGRIDEILSAKSGDRREIFEEAAGISKFRYRKEEAERKLQGTEANLVRINDKIAELELTVLPLKEQSETAQQYLAFRDELRVLEVSVWLFSLEKLKEDFKKVTEDYEALTKQYDEESELLTRLYAESEELSGQMRAKELEAEQKRGELSAAEERQNAAENDIAVTETSVGNIKENIDRIESEKDEQQGRSKSLAEQISERESRISGIEREIGEADGELDSIAEESEQLLKASEDISGREDALEALRQRCQEEINRLNIEASSSSTAKAELEERGRRLENDIKTQRDALESAQAEFDKITSELKEQEQTAEALKNVISGYELRLSNRKKKLEASNEAKTKLQIELSAAENRVRLLSDMEKDYEGFSRAVKIVMQEKGDGGLKGIVGPLSSLIKVAEGHTLAVETALGMALQNIVVDNEDAAKAAIRYLQKRDGGRATFLPVSAIRGRRLDERIEDDGFVGIASELVSCEAPYREIIVNALGRTVVATDMDRAVEMAKRHSYRFRIVTLDGQIINAGGSMTGGSAARGTGILSRKNELTKLEAGLEAIRQKLLENTDEVRELEREVAHATYEADVARTEQRQAEDAVLMRRGEAETVRERLTSAQAAVGAYEEELNGITERLNQAETRLDETGSEVGRKRAELEDIEAQIEKLSGTGSELGEKRGELTERSHSLRELKSGLQSERDALSSSLAELRRMSEQYSTDMERREALIARYNLQLAELDRSIEAKRAELEGFKAGCAAIRAEISGINDERMKLEAKRTAADRESKEKNESIISLERERGRLEQKKTEAELGEKQLIDKLWESYGLTRTTAEDVAVEQESIPRANRRISELKREISRLGDVNVGAIEEYRRLSERYEYLTTQRDDVEKSMEELNRIIAEITGRMKEIFAVEFKKINESFSETFTELFGGGQGRLELEDEEDILACGIEIRVQPPGKALKTITLLSGGEKAFVAIALYFAILKVRPTPFCVMDEIEAALDEVNVERFAQYMRTFCHSTQFIVITHRRGTMEESDILYGVTMQSLGISKILALNVNEAERELGIKLG